MGDSISFDHQKWSEYVIHMNQLGVDFYKDCLIYSIVIKPKNVAI